MKYGFTVMLACLYSSLLCIITNVYL